MGHAQGKGILAYSNIYGTLVPLLRDPSYQRPLLVMGNEQLAQKLPLV